MSSVTQQYLREWCLFIVPSFRTFYNDSKPEIRDPFPFLSVSHVHGKDPLLGDPSRAMIDLEGFPLHCRIQTGHKTSQARLISHENTSGLVTSPACRWCRSHRHPKCRRALGAPPADLEPRRRVAAAGRWLGG